MLELFPVRQTGRSEVVRRNDEPRVGVPSADEILARRRNLLLNMPTPRPVQLRRSGRYLPWAVYGLLVVYIIVTFWTLLPVLRNDEAPTSAQTWLILIPLVGVAIFTWSTFHGRSAEKNLLSSGAIGLATIRHQFNSEDTLHSYIDYEVSDSHGHVWQKRTMDDFGGYSAGMTVVVFYEVDHPERQIADCSTEYYEIVLPEEK